MEKIPIITLITDFGTKDYYVGTMKGVIYGINPLAKVVDITHEIKPQDIIEAAFMLYCCYKYFPVRTIHMVIVDPTVGSNRRALLVVSEEYYFIAPDNGVLSFIYDTGTVSTVIEITSEHYFLENISATFHGRDIFAPVAAWLSKGIESSKFGEPIEDYLKLTIPKAKLIPPNLVRGIVLHIDKFGNIITNIAKDDYEKALKEFKKPSFSKIILNQFEITSFKKSYYEGGKNELIALIGSSNFLEIASFQGNAGLITNASRGTEVNMYF